MTADVAKSKMARREIKSFNVDQIYGELREDVHFAGYAFERACMRLETLLDENNNWKKCAPGFTDVNVFLDSVRLDKLRGSAEERKRIALRIKALQPKASNRAIAKTLGVDHKTVSRDVGENSPRGGKNAKGNNGNKRGNGENSPPALTGAAAAKLVARREERKGRDADAADSRQEIAGDGVIECRRGDFRAVLSDLRDVDAVITDPPYGKEFLPLLRDLAAFADGVLKPDGVLAVLYGQTYLQDAMAQMTGFRPYRWTACYLTEGHAYISHPRGVQSNWKPILVYGGTAHRFGDVFRSTGDGAAKHAHAWGQNLEAFQAIIKSLTDPGATIVDPFAGGGTTLLAAKSLGRNAIGADVAADAAALALGAA